LQFQQKNGGLTKVTNDTTNCKEQLETDGSIDCRWPAIVVMLSDGGCDLYDFNLLHLLEATDLRGAIKKFSVKNIINKKNNNKKIKILFASYSSKF